MILFDEGKIIADSQSLRRSIVLDKAGVHHLTLVCTGGGSASFDVDIAAPDVDFVLNGVYLCSGDDILDIKVNLVHKAPGSSSRQLLRGVVGGRSRISFDGKITVEHGAVGTAAFQTNNNIQLSDQAVVQTSPQLEIYADDVQCSHGATAGMLNEDELFYMRSRGLTLREARRLQIVSFLTPAMTFLDEKARETVLSAIPNE